MLMSGLSMVMRVVEADYMVKMQAVIDEHDGRERESLHWEQDKLLAQCLRDIGYGELVDLYESTDKWYA